MLAINLPTWLVDIWTAYSDVIVPALVTIVLAILTWVAVTIKADAKARAAKSDAELAALEKMNNREDTRPELNTLSAEVEDSKQAIRYLAEMFDKVFQNSTLDEQTKNELTILKNKLVFGVKEDLITQLTAEKTALEQQIAGLEEQLKAATAVITKETRTRR
jgi:uncharacterized membrane protein YccC